MSLNAYEKTSTNGRWGIALVGEVSYADLQKPVQGEIKHLGTVAGIDTWHITPCESGEWFWLTDDVEPVAGAVELTSMGLQSSASATLLRMTDSAVVKIYGYKRRGSDYRAIDRGVSKHIPAPILAAMGIVSGTDVKAREEIPAPEPLVGAMAAAFAKLKG